jgi:ribonuclease BN (tRNA processing enzyme)
MPSGNPNATQSKIVLLGTGTPNAEPDRSGPSVAIISGNTTCIVDFGPGVIRRAMEAHKNGIPELEPAKISTAFCTHLHSDHTAGYPDLILTPWVLGRTRPLDVYGPSGITSMTEHILSAYNSDISERTDGLQPSNDTGFNVNAREIEPGVIFENANMRVEAFHVNHGGLESYGYKIHLPDRVVAISGDTAPFDCIAENYRDVDVLIHEVYSTDGFEKYPPEWQKYHSATHTSSKELAHIASIAKPGLLVLYHQLLNGVTEEQLLDEIRADYSGKIAYGRDLDVF